MSKGDGSEESEEEDELGSSGEDELGSSGKKGVTSSRDPAADRNENLIFVDSDSEEDTRPPRVIPDADAPVNNPIMVDSDEEGPTAPQSQRDRSPPIVIDDSDEEDATLAMQWAPARACTPIFVDSGSEDDAPVATTPGVVPERAPAPRRTKKERDAAAIANTAPISTYFPAMAETSTGLRIQVPIDARFRGVVRVEPAGAIGSSVYHSRIDRPAVLALAPFPLPVPPEHFAYTDGGRPRRKSPLQIVDLWIGNKNGPPPMTLLDENHRCCVCLALKSHPVS
ncbi:hypothetical protein C8R44DRAFT_871779 [Mycena epipterygia]|nr:hypothetical protein C8R44DRAFT_871779 [Mycena epipterygia]